jgi:protein phosphatase
VRAYREASEVSGIDALRHAVESANRAVHEENRLNPGLRQMGTTCTAAAICGDDLLLAHVGDCRAYRISEEGVEQLTRDHSLVALLVEQKTLTPEQARVDPRRNLITRSLGQNSEVKVDAREVSHALGAGDTLLLCSDGLHGVVEEAELAHLVNTPDLDGICRDLVSLANERGGPDNITVLVARRAEPEIEHPTVRPRADIRAEEPALPRQYPAWLLALILVAVVLAVYVIVSLTSY